MRRATTGPRTAARFYRKMRSPQWWRIYAQTIFPVLHKTPIKYKCIIYVDGEGGPNIYAFGSVIRIRTDIDRQHISGALVRGDSRRACARVSFIATTRWNFAMNGQSAMVNVFSRCVKMDSGIPCGVVVITELMTLTRRLSLRALCGIDVRWAPIAKNRAKSRCDLRWMGSVGLYLMWNNSIISHIVNVSILEQLHYNK